MGMIIDPYKFAAAASWQTVFSQTLNSNVFNGYFTYTIRQVLAASLWSPAVSGTKVRVTFESNTVSGLVLQDCHIGEKAAAGDAYDFAATPTRLTFNGGGTGFSIAANATKLSDEVTFAFDPSKDYVIAMDAGNSSGQGGFRALVTLSGGSTYNKVADDSATVDATGYTDSTGTVAALCGVKMVEVFG